MTQPRRLDAVIVSEFGIGICHPEFGFGVCTCRTFPWDDLKKNMILPALYARLFTHSEEERESAGTIRRAFYVFSERTVQFERSKTKEIPLCFVLNATHSLHKVGIRASSTAVKQEQDTQCVRLA